ncbi:hypothetical protein BS50DRAFT_276156 [Corynespora cassiicola Philippines]|uniref:Uncharacterized protein n=1 Tax=Corynespora cassiicola Philippines TaxID=1448308 RepID=A0A2T2P0J3_CORCC|nr:hypothetical protein BS50DRAFT_276156 [Corynespora cassiicola Philippines]
MANGATRSIKTKQPSSHSRPRQRGLTVADLHKGSRAVAACFHTCCGVFQTFWTLCAWLPRCLHGINTASTCICSSSNAQGPRELCYRTTMLCFVGSLEVAFGFMHCIIRPSCTNDRSNPSGAVGYQPRQTNICIQGGCPNVLTSHHKPNS